MSEEVGSSSVEDKQSCQVCFVNDVTISHVIWYDCATQGEESGPSSQQVTTDSSSSVPASSGYSTEQSGSSTQAELQGGVATSVIVDRSRPVAGDEEMEIVEAGETVVYSTSQDIGMLYIGTKSLWTLKLTVVLVVSMFMCSL